MTIEETVRNALQEDIGAGDVTSDLCVPADRRATGSFIAREPMVIAGVELLPLMFEDIDVRAASGAVFGSGEVIAAARGTARRLLAHERVALNFLQHLSGIATETRRYVDATAGTGCRVLDTRKTTPGLRQLEKMAVIAGGGTNHRIGLYDAVLIKNNHITAAGGVHAALAATWDSPVPVEIEVRTKAELEEALAFGAKHLLLDNLTPQEAREWIQIIAGRATVELSGGITLETARAYAETGADFISVGALTHSVRSVDINFRLELK